MGRFWRSPDLWVRQADPLGDPAGDPPYNMDPPHQAALFGLDNWIRVRVKNVGTQPSRESYVRVYLNHFAGTQFVYPTDFAPMPNPGNPIPWPPVQATYLLGETWLGSLGRGATVIVNIRWPAALVPPNNVGGTQWHPCFLAEGLAADRTDAIRPARSHYTHLAQRNVTIINVANSNVREMTGVIGHANDSARRKILVIQRGKLPESSTVWVRFLDAKVDAAVAVALAKRRAGPIAGTWPKMQYRDGRRVFMLASGTRLVVPVPMAGGRLTPVVLGATLPTDANPGYRRGGAD